MADPTKPTKAELEDEHLSKEQLLAAALDEPLSPAARAHLETCGFCHLVVERERDPKVNPVFALARRGVDESFWEQVKEALYEADRNLREAATCEPEDGVEEPDDEDGPRDP